MIEWLPSTSPLGGHPVLKDVPARGPTPWRPYFPPMPLLPSPPWWGGGFSLERNTPHQRDEKRKRSLAESRLYSPRVLYLVIPRQQEVRLFFG